MPGPHALPECMQGWFRVLIEQGNSLPDFEGASWHVEVVCKPVGSLGTFRRSRVTGLWFAGPHRLHMLGNGPRPDLNLGS